MSITFFKSLIHQLSSNSVYAEESVPKDWSARNRLLLYRNPCYILRKRMDGTLKAIEQIIENVEDRLGLIAAIKKLVMSDINDG